MFQATYITCTTKLRYNATFYTFVTVDAITKEYRERELIGLDSLTK